MKIITFPYDNAFWIKKIIKDFLNGTFPYYKNRPYSNIINTIYFDEEKRKILYKILIKQYEKFQLTKSVKKNIELLKDKNTFTVTTAQQPSIFLNPVLTIYKIIDCIQYSNKLNAEYKQYNFVPVFWLGNEDDDTKETNYAYIKNEKFTWQTNNKEILSLLSNSGLENICKQVREKINLNNNGSIVEELINLFEKAYTKYNTFSEATSFVINKLFCSYGLIVINAADNKLKKYLSNIIIQEINNQTIYKEINSQNLFLLKNNYHIQAQVQQFNFFLKNGTFRSKILLKEDKFIVKDTGKEFSKKDIEILAQKKSENFIPNVFTRAIYQQIVLPNVAYIGGQSELSYWLQMTKLFEKINVTFPNLILRNSYFFLPERQYIKIKKIVHNIADILFKNSNEIIKDIINDNINTNNLLKNEKKNIVLEFDKIKKYVYDVDKSLLPFVESKLVKSLKNIEQIKEKLIKAYKNKEKSKIATIEKVKNILFPKLDTKTILQERFENIISMQLYNNKSIIEELILKTQRTYNAKAEIILYIN